MIKLRANIFIGLLFVLTSMLTLAADKAASAAEVEKLNEQIRVLDKELAVLKEVSTKQLDAQDKRIADLSLSASHQSNHIAMVANQTASLGNYIGVVSLLIAVIAAVAGIFVYRRIPQKAADEANKWFRDNSKQLMGNLKNHATQAKQSMRAHTDAVEKTRLQTETSIKEMKEAASKLFSQKDQRSDEQHTASVNIESIKMVTEASKALEAKPETEFSANDHYTRGLAYYTANNFQSALASFDNAIAKNPEAEELASLLFAKGTTLGKLGKAEEEIAVYEQINQRFSNDNTPVMREQVASALFNKGVTLGELGKPEEEIAVYEQINKRFGNDNAPAMREQVASALFNKGVTLGTLGKFEEQITVYEQINQRFGKDNTSEMQERVAKALVNKGFTLGELGKSDEAIAVYEEIDQRFGKDDTPEMQERVARALLNKGFTLGVLGRTDEAIAVYEEIYQRFGKDDVPALREKVAQALNGGAFRQIMLSKQQWTNLENRTRYLKEAIVKLERSLKIYKTENNGIVQGNYGYAHFLLANSELAETHTLTCLQLGGEESLKGQRADAKLNRLEPEDTEYEAFLEICWQKLHPKT